MRISGTEPEILKPNTPLNFDPWGLNSIGCAQDSTTL